MSLQARIVSIASIGMFLSMLDTGIVSIAISKISENLDGDLNLSPYIIASYSIFLCSTILIFGSLSKRFGSIHIFKGGIFLFGLFSLLCGLSSTIEALLISRGLQGIAAAMIQATAITLISIYVNERERAKSISMVITFASIGPIVAPSLGGLIINNYSWAWLFYLNVPFCGIALFLSRNIKPTENFKEKENLILLTIYPLLFFMFMLGINVSGFHYLAIISIIIFILLLVFEIKSNNGLFINKKIISSYYYSSLLLFLIMGIFTSFMFILAPFRLLISNNISKVSLITMLLPIFTVIFSRIAPIFIRRFNPRTVSIIGIFMMSTCTYVLFMPNFNIYSAIISLSLFGIGCGILQPANTLVLFESSNREYHGISNSLSRLSVNLGIALGASMVSIFYF